MGREVKMESENILEVDNFKLEGQKAEKNFNLKLKKDSIHSIIFKEDKYKDRLIDFLTGNSNDSEAELRIEGQKINQSQLKELFKEKIYLINQFSAVNPERDPLAIFKFKKNKNKNTSTVFPEMTIAENIFFGREPLKSFLFFKSIDNQKMNELTKELLSLFEMELRPGQKMLKLSPLEKQLIELLKAVSYQVDILLIDQAVIELPKEKKQVFFKFMQKLKKKGITIIYFTKEFEEVFQTSDYVSILKEEANREVYEVSELEYNELALLLMGK